MASQLFLNNFETVFIAAVKDAPTSGSPDTELDYGILRISDGAAGALINPSNGDYYILTAFKRAGTVESNIEIMRVTAVDNSVPGECRITVQRAQEGTTPQAYVAGDRLALRLTAGGASNLVQGNDPRLSDARPPTGPAGGVLAGTYPNPTFAVDMATQTELDAHVTATAGAHTASAISNVPAGGISATTVQGAIDELNAEKEPAITAGTASQYWRGDKTWQDFFADVRAATLAGLSTATNAVISAADTVLSALGKLQAQITNLVTGKQDTLVSGANIKTINGESLLGSGNVTTAVAGAITASGLTQSSSKLLGRTSTGVGAVEEISIGNNLTLSDGVLSAEGSTPPIATQAEAEAGTDNTKMMTPLRTAQQVAARLATQAEAKAGADNTKLMTPLRTAQFIASLTQPDVIGLVQVRTGDGVGVYQRIDGDFNPPLVTQSSFNTRPIYRDIVTQTIDGQAMVRIPKFWFKAGTVPSGTYAGKAYWMISDQPLDGFSVHPAFIGAGGAELDQIWVGKYQAGYDGSKAISVAGAMPKVSTDFSTARAYAYARNVGGVTGFRLWSYYDLAAIQMLATIEYGGLDMQSLIGYGRVTQGGAANVDAADVVQATWRGIVGLWGNVWQMTDGLKRNGGTWWRWQYNVPGNTTVNDFSTGYVNTSQSAPTTNGYPVTFNIPLLSAGIIVPATLDGSASNGSTGDYVYSNTNTEDRIVYNGGDYAGGAGAGLFFLNAVNAPSAAYSTVGFRLAKV